LGAATCGHFREWLEAAALARAPRSPDRGVRGELILQGFRKESSEGLVSGQSSIASVFQLALDIRERQKVPGWIDLG
jgi:hypothetical protein